MNRMGLWGGAAAIAVIAGIVGGAAGVALSAPRDSAIRNYLLGHPEILRDMADRLERREAQARLGPLRGAAEAAFPGAVLGNPRGTVTLVEFSDYACGYCRRSVEDIDAMVAANPKLKVVLRELPILSPESETAARMALAAAAQGRFAAFHHAMFAAGRPSAATIAAAARTAGLDLDAARAFAGSERATAELRKNASLAQALGFQGTPSWIVGGQMMAGAVGRDQLAGAIAAAQR